MKVEELKITWARNLIVIFICSWWLMWNMEEICSKNDLIKDRSITLIPGHSVTYQMTPLSSSKTLGFLFGYKEESFGRILLNPEFILRYRHCSKLFRELRKESEFRQHQEREWISATVLPKFNKSMREKEEKWERENFEFRQRCYQNSCYPNSLPECVLCARSVKC